MKLSRYYRAVRKELASGIPADVWSEAGIWFVVFDLTVPTGGTVVFLLDSSLNVLSARKVLMDESGEQATVTDLNGDLLTRVHSPSDGAATYERF
ncbi:MAG TPA: hypothetical protein VFW83_09150 [Bryobacteraceae bacterium]|nr:hypothetical protein [Bryobacteraceae bacterium]